MKHSNFIVRTDNSFELNFLDTFKQYGSVLVQVFAATTDQKKVSELLLLIAEKLPDAVVIGASSDGTIDQGTLHTYGNTILIAVSGFDKTHIMLAVSENESSSFQSGVDIAKNVCTDNSKVLIAFSEASSINGEEFLEGVNSVNDKLIISGGVASTPTFSDTYIIAGQRILNKGAVSVSLNSDYLRAVREHSFGWQTVGKEMTITDAENNCVRSIDNKTPCEVFKHYLGDDIINAMPGIGSAFPLMIKRDGTYIARGIIALSGEHFIVSGNVKVNDRVYIGYGNPYNIAHQNQLTNSVLNSIDIPEVIFSYYCEGRRLFMPDDMVDYELKALSSISPVCGLFTLGEFYTEQNYLLLNFSSTLLALSEQEQVNISKRSDIKSEPVHDVFGIVSEGLFHLIDTRTRELEQQAYHDELTGLPNRAFFYEMLSMSMHRACKKNETFFILFIDIDNFRKINDTHGHNTGDRLLVKIAEKIKNKIGSDDTLARYGGDEFLVLHNHNSSVDQVNELSSNLLSIFNNQFSIDDKSFSLSASIGISIYPNDGEDQETLIKYADTAMYEVKFSGKNNFAYYHSDMTEKSIYKATMEADLRRALVSDEFTVFYQPQVNLESGKIVSAEALARWNHPEKGLIFPSDFIGLAEETGLIHRLGEVIFDKALGQMRSWLDDGIGISKISINISAEQFIHDDMIPLITRHLEKYALAPKYLDLEITESGIMADSEKSLPRLRELQSFGITISIDDFGTGYSSLSYLKQFKVNTLKIDKSFIDNIPNDEDDVAITKLIISLAKSLDLNIVAEGVEASEHEQFLIDQGCTLAQGYYYSRAIPVDEFVKLFRSWG